MVIPFLKKLYLVFLNDPLNRIHLRLAKAAPLYSYWVWPEFCYSIIALNVCVRGFSTIVRIKENTIRSLR